MIAYLEGFGIGCGAAAVVLIMLQCFLTVRAIPELTD